MSYGIYPHKSPTSWPLDSQIADVRNAEMVNFLGFLSPFGISSFETPKCFWTSRPQDPQNAESRFPETLFLPGLYLSRFRDSKCRNARTPCPQDSRNVESRYADGIFPFGIFPKPGLLPTSPQDGLSSLFHDFVTCDPL
jgi:hypothetical protein